MYPEAHSLYLDLHQNPELSSHETQTAAKLATRLRGLGYEVTEHVGGTGIVAILKNGAGPNRHAAHGTRCASGGGENRLCLMQAKCMPKMTLDTTFP